MADPAENFPYEEDGAAHQSDNFSYNGPAANDPGEAHVDPVNALAADEFGITPDQVQSIGDVMGNIGPEGISPEQAAQAADMIQDFGGSASPEDVVGFVNKMEMEHDHDEHMPPPGEYDPNMQGDMGPGPMDPMAAGSDAYDLAAGGDMHSSGVVPPSEGEYGPGPDSMNDLAADQFGITPDQAQSIGEAMGDIGPEGISPEQAAKAADMIHDFGGSASPEDVAGFVNNMEMEHSHDHDEHVSPEGEYGPGPDSVNDLAADQFGITPDQAQSIGEAMGDIGPEGISPEQAAKAADMIHDFGGSASPEDVAGFVNNMEMEYGHDGHMPPQGEYDLNMQGDMGSDPIDPIAAGSDVYDPVAGGDMPPPYPEGDMYTQGEVPPPHSEGDFKPEGDMHAQGDMTPPTGEEMHAPGDAPPPFPEGNMQADVDIPPPEGGWGAADPEAGSHDLGIAFTDSAAKDPSEATDPFAAAPGAQDVPPPTDTMMDSAADELAGVVERSEGAMPDDHDMTASGPDAMEPPPEDDQAGMV